MEPEGLHGGECAGEIASGRLAACSVKGQADGIHMRVAASAVLGCDARLLLRLPHAFRFDLGLVAGPFRGLLSLPSGLGFRLQSGTFRRFLCLAPRASFGGEAPELSLLR